MGYIMQWLLTPIAFLPNGELAPLTVIDNPTTLAIRSDFECRISNVLPSHTITQMLHGAGIFTNIFPKNQPVMQVNIPYMEHMGYNSMLVGFMVFYPRWFPFGPRLLIHARREGHIRRSSKWTRPKAIVATEKLGWSENGMQKCWLFTMKHQGLRGKVG